MSSSTPKVLIIGESSTLSFLTWVFTRSNWLVTVLPFIDRKVTNKDQSWLLFTEHNSFEFSPHLVIANLVDLSTLLAANANYNFKFDYIILTPKFYNILQNSPSFFNKVINAQTIIFVDSTDNPWIISELDKIYPNNVVLSIYSDIDCRLLGLATNCYQLMDDNTRIMIGFNSGQTKAITITCLNLKGLQGLKLSNFKNIYENLTNTGSFIVVPANSHKTLTKTIWKRLISIICFETLSIIFEEPDILSLAKELNVAPIMKGIFQEILIICKRLKVKGLPQEYSIESKKLLKLLIMTEGNRKIKRTSVLTNKNYLPKFIDSTKSFFDFSQGYEINTINILLQLLNLADNNQIQTPFIESVFSFMTRLITIRDGIDINGKSCPSKLFQIKNNKNKMMKLKTINGIPPEKNMMNFPPFNPLPLPKPPTQSFIEKPVVFMSGVHFSGNSDKDISKNQEDSNASVDSHLRDLIAGREALTYNDDIFYDASVDIQERSSTTTSPVPPAPTKKSSRPQQQILQLQPSQPSNQHIQLPPPTFQPQHITHLTDGQGNIYMMQPNGSIILVNSLQNHSPSVPNFRTNPVKRRQPFYHVPTPISKHTSSYKLRDSHANLLELVQFNGLMDQGTSSRYGDLDTSSTVLNSANNSGRSSGRSSLAPSRGSTRNDSPRPIPKSAPHTLKDNYERSNNSGNPPAT